MTLDSVPSPGWPGRSRGGGSLPLHASRWPLTCSFGALHGAVDSGAGAAEQHGELPAGVLPGGVLKPAGIRSRQQMPTPGRKGDMSFPRSPAPCRNDHPGIQVPEDVPDLDSQTALRHI